MPEHHRPVFRAHPWAFYGSLGIFLTGLLRLLFPEYTAGSVTDTAFPDLLLLLFNIVWVVGGGFAAWGLLRGLARYEAAGMLLMGAGMLSYVVAIVAVYPQGALGSAFVLLLSVGSVRRAWVLLKGYETVVRVRRKGA